MALTRLSQSMIEHNTDSDLVNVRDYGVTGDGTTNDTAAFHAAFASGAADFYIPAGEYRVANLIVPSTVKRLTGSGARTVFKSASSLGAYVPWIYLDQLHDFEISNFSTEFTNALGTTSAAIYGGTCVNGRIHDIRSHSGYMGVALASCDSVAVDDSEFDNSILYCLHALAASSDITFSGNAFLSAPSGHVISINGGSGHILKENRITQTAAGSFGISMFGCSESIVAGNIVRATYLEGIQGTNVNRLKIDGNIILCNPALHTDMGISLHGDTADCYDCAITDNSIHYAGATGIGLASDSRVSANIMMHSIVAGNKIYNPNRRNNANYTGVWCYGSNTQHNTIRDNDIIDTDNYVRYGVSEYNNGDGAPNNNIFIHNQFRGGGRLGEALVLGGGSVIKGL